MKSKPTKKLKSNVSEITRSPLAKVQIFLSTFNLGDALAYDLSVTFTKHFLSPNTYQS